MLSSLVLLLTAVPWMVTSSGGFRVNLNRQIGPGHVGVADNGNLDAMTFLERTGYLDDLDAVKNRHHSPDNVKTALREFQQFVGIPVTGRLDVPTVHMMKKPRCGVPDVIKPSQRQKNQTDDNDPENYDLMGSEWPTEDITYKWIKYTHKMNKDDQRRVVANSFQKWSRVTPLTFREIMGQEHADINLGFYTGRHKAFCGPFNGRDGSLAHAYGPGPGEQEGSIHFNENEPWAMHGSYERDETGLDQVATHEIGHALGLDHSKVEGAVMFPYYYSDNTELSQDDISGIQKKYGPPHGGATGPTENYCGLRFDDIVRGEGGVIYAFRGEYYYILSPGGLTRKRKISEHFTGAPHSPDAVVFDRFSDRLYMFKGQYYYRYYGYTLSDGFPKLLGRDFKNIDAAIMRFNRDFYLFRGDNITRWEEGMEHYPRGFPQSITDFYGNNSPDRVDGAFEFNNSITFLFNGDRYWKYIVYKQKEQSSPGYPKSIKPFWLHCGFVPGRDEESIFGYVG